MFRFRQHIGIALTTAFIFGMVWQSYTIVNFYINQESIAAEHCENKDKPELNCKGQCHLKKQLEAAAPELDEKRETQGSLKTSFLLLVYTQPIEDLVLDRSGEVRISFGQEQNQTTDFVSDILDPPRIV